MKIAYLILCHKNETQIKKLISQLDDSNCDFFIHIDKKTTNICICENDHIFICPEKKRVDVQWATFSMVQATINLINYLIDTGRSYDYVCLLSGQDFPIRSNQYIQEFFYKHNGTNFIEVISHSSSFYSRYRKRSELYYPYFLLKRSFFSKALRKAYIIISGGYNHTFNLFKRKTKYSFEFGSQWWALSFSCIKWIHTFLLNNPNYIEYFNNSTTPDECFFQTIFCASPFSKYQGERIMYLEWSENKNNPKILTREDICNINFDPHFLFARKFDFDVDDYIMEYLKRR